MRPQVVSALFQFPDDWPEQTVSVKITGKKEGGFDLFILQCFENIITPLGKFMTRENECYFLFGGIAANYRAMTAEIAPCSGGPCFFEPPCASFAASR